MDYTEGNRNINQELLYKGLIIKCKKIYKQFIFLSIGITPSDKETYEMSRKFKHFERIMCDLSLNPAIEMKMEEYKHCVAAQK